MSKQINTDLLTMILSDNSEQAKNMSELQFTLTMNTIAITVLLSLSMEMSLRAGQIPISKMLVELTEKVADVAERKAGEK